ncbi:MAG: phosphate ABC transporter permease subunit PstC, partial [Bdellovibrio sp. CG10_big_fil_rev_8_21_14_0_10_47_8]
MRFVSLFLFGRAGRREVRLSDFAFVVSLRLLALLVVLIFASIVLFLTLESLPSLQANGWRFLIQSDWVPTEDLYGALPFIYGTLVTSFVALVIAAPVAVGSAIFLTEVCPPWLSKPVGFLIEMLAAIPSVVYGLWGIFVLAPAVRNYLEPFLSQYFGYLPLFQGPPLGIGVLSASLILAIMILPTITAVCREVFRAIPMTLREGALAMGATKWEMIKVAVIETGLSGIISAVVLGLGRAMGETMAVTMLIGNRPLISSSLFAPGATMASVIANEYPEAGSGLHLSSLTGIGLTLFLVSLAVNSVAKILVHLTTRRL